MCQNWGAETANATPTALECEFACSSSTRTTRTSFSSPLTKFFSASASPGRTTIARGRRASCGHSPPGCERLPTVGRALSWHSTLTQMRAERRVAGTEETAFAYVFGCDAVLPQGPVLPSSTQSQEHSFLKSHVCPAFDLLRTKCRCQIYFQFRGINRFREIAERSESLAVGHVSCLLAADEDGNVLRKSER
jgi:hypothetical protein